MADCKESTEGTNEPQTPVIMKFDAAEELNDNSTNDGMEGQSAENSLQDPPSPPTKSSNKTSFSGPILSPSKLDNSNRCNDVFNSRKSKAPVLLRPSQLSAVTNNPVAPSKTVLKPAKFQNPFAKVNDSDIIEDNTPPLENNKVDSEKSQAKAEEKSVDEVKPKFLPLGATQSTKDTDNSVNNSIASVSAPTFVFGQNLKERVTVSNDTDGSDNSEKEDAKGKEANENGSSELLFSNAAAICRTTSKPGLTLTQAAQELEEANRANKRKYSQVTLLTGEEGETNILQINCKLFAFDKATSNWQERGRGTLRLNDRDEESRLVGRTAGTQRLILNTKVWPGMTAERAGPKSLRLTAMDVHGDIRIFIVQAAPKEVDQLHHLLMQRLKRAQERQPKKLATEH